MRNGTDSLAGFTRRQTNGKGGGPVGRVDKEDVVDQSRGRRTVLVWERCMRRTLRERGLWTDPSGC